MGLSECKKIIEQRNLISHVLHSRMEELVNEKRTTISINGPAGCNIFNETYHNAIKYCEIERKFGLYNTIIALKKQLGSDFEQLNKILASQTDEHLFLKEEIKLWAVDQDAELSISLLDRLRDENFDKDIRSDLYSYIMNGYLTRNDLESAHEVGISFIKLNEENWKGWQCWVIFYRKICEETKSQEIFIDSICGMIKSFMKAIRYKSHTTFMYMSEIIDLITSRSEFISGKNEEDLKPLEQEFEEMLHSIPVWIWVIWLPTMLLQFRKIPDAHWLRTVLIKAINISTHIYPEYIHQMLNVISANEGDEMQDDIISDAIEKISSNYTNKVRYNSIFTQRMSAIYEDILKIDDANEYQDVFDQLYSATQIDSKTTNILLTNCKQLWNSKAQFKNQENHHKISTLISLVEENREEHKNRLLEGIVDIGNLLPIKDRVGVPQFHKLYSEKSIRHCVKSMYMSPEVKVVYEGKKFKLEVIFVSKQYKFHKYTFEKSHINQMNCYIANHYTRLLNTRMTKHHETIFRDLKLPLYNFAFLEDDYILREKNIHEDHLIDLVDKEINNQDCSSEYPLELLSQKKNLSEVFKCMKEMLPSNFLKREVLKRLDDPMELFYWRKRYGHSIGINAIKSLIFCSHTRFDQLRICYKNATIIDETCNIKLLDLQKQKIPKLPLRLTSVNKDFLKDYMIEGAVYPAIMSTAQSLKKYTKSFDFCKIMSQFCKDALSNQDKESFLLEKYLETNIEGYFLQVIKMSSKYQSKKGFKGLKFKQFLSLMHYVDSITSQEYLKGLTISHRAWI